ncbi:MAG: hypothetical protein QXI09_01345 [Candidatus Aenigmatarchaeota archaeon]
MEIISFDYLKKILNEEKNSSNLAKIPDNFYELVRDYVKAKIKMIKDKKDELEVRNMKRIVENIFNLRERKILNLAVIHVRIGTKPINLTKEEEEIFYKICEILKKRRDVINSLSKIIEGEKEVEKMIVFKQDFPSFIGSDGLTYGPFKKGDIAKLPDEDMKDLIERGVAEEFEVQK